MRSSGSWTPLRLVNWTTGYFRRHGVERPRLDAEILLAHVLGVRRLDLYLRFDAGVQAPDRERYRDLVRRRAEDRVSVAHLTGEREFWSHTFLVGPHVLSPRPETEGVVEAVLELEPALLIDAGTGCGAIACAVASALPGVRVLAIDRSHEALRVARRNVERLGLGDRVCLAAGSWLEAVGGPVDVIAANPPYVPTGEIEALPPEVRHEPRTALDGGPDGLDAVRALASRASRCLRRPGALVLEVGAGQAAEVERLLRAAGADRAESRKDLAGVERVVVGRFGEA